MSDGAKKNLVSQGLASVLGTNDASDFEPAETPRTKPAAQPRKSKVKTGGDDGPTVTRPRAKNKRRGPGRPPAAEELTPYNTNVKPKTLDRVNKYLENTQASAFKTKRELTDAALNMLLDREERLAAKVAKMRAKELGIKG